VFYVSLTAGGILAVGLIFYYFLGKDWISVPACIIYKETGLYCPACGGTRSVLALLHGDIREALWFHPVVPYTCVIYGSYLLTETFFRLTKSRSVIPIKFWKGCILLGLFLLVVHILLRNVLKFGFGIVL